MNRARKTDPNTSKVSAILASKNYKKYINAILPILFKNKNGLTSCQISEILDVPVHWFSSVLTKMENEKLIHRGNVTRFNPKTKRENIIWFFGESLQKPRSLNCKSKKQLYHDLLEVVEMFVIKQEFSIENSLFEKPFLVMQAYRELKKKVIEHTKM